MSTLWQDTAERAARYIETIHERRVAPTAEAIAALKVFDSPLPKSQTDPAQIIALLDEVGSPATYATTGGRYFGFVTGGALPATIAANWLVTAWDENAAQHVSSPLGALLEDVALRWMIDLFRLPSQTGGAFVTGATQANFAALAAARHHVLHAAGWDVEADGLFGAPPITVIVGDEVHSSVLKTLGMIGLGRERVVRIPTDDQGRMRTDALPTISAPAIVILQAGNVNTGAFDPFEPLCEWAHETNAWVHVDGAFGLWAAASPKLAHLTAGIQNADSWITDGHKWLNTPYDAGYAFVRHAEALKAAMSINAPYFMLDEQREPMNYNPQQSQRARGIETWAALMSLGSDGVAALIERCCRYAQTFARELRAAGFEVPHDVVLNQVMVRFGDDETTRRVIKAVQHDGTIWAGATVWKGRAAMRISVSSWATTDEDVARSVDAIVRAADT